MSATQAAVHSPDATEARLLHPLAGAAKRLLDVTVAAAALALVWPLMALIALVIKLDSPGPVVFNQIRVGRNRRFFTLHKFRTMRVGTPELPAELLENPQAAVTRVGRLLRRTSLDELPQLINVLRGEMSLVGPRPLLYNHEGLLSLRDAHGLNYLKPGITGLAQINGRDDIGDQEKAMYEREYAARRSFWLDLVILARTVCVVATGRGAN